MEIKITQSSVRPDIWFLYFGEMTIQLSEEQVIELARASVNTTLGQELLQNYVKKYVKTT